MINFVTSLSNPQLLLDKPVFIITGSHYPLLVFARLFQQIKNNLLYNVQLIDLDTASMVDLLPSLQTSFLGQRTLFWFGNLGDYDEQIRAKIYKLFASYQGPNILGCFAQEQLAGIINVSCSLVSTRAEWSALVQWLFPNRNHELLQRQVDIFLERRGSLTLDQAVMLIFYCMTLGSRTDIFVKNWLEKIITPEQSLFTLSSLFFAKKTTHFFTYWQMLAETYPPPFWTTFWSEQLFKAYWFVYYSKQKNLTEAKKIGHRLPFSFMQHDWKKISLQELKIMHNALYIFDCSLKNNTITSFERIFAKFFQPG